jgi:hypothetical protein
LDRKTPFAEIQENTAIVLTQLNVCHRRELPPHMGSIAVRACFSYVWELFGLCHGYLLGCAGWVGRNNINYLADLGAN